MQQDKFDMDNKLRQLENQQLPDLSAMDAHWKQMAQQLAPGEKNAVPRHRRNTTLKRFLLAASIVAIAVTVYFARHNSNKEVRTVKNPAHEPSIKSNNNNTIQPKINIPAFDSTYTLNQQQTVKATHTSTAKPSLKIGSRPENILPGIDGSEPVANASPVVAPAMTLDNFYTQLQKPAQQFSVNGSTGAVIEAAEGTRLLIPPSAFMDAEGKAVLGNVIISIEEYYKYADIVAAHLTTTSNDQQLETGGMIRLAAVYNNHEVQLRTGKAIQVSMPTKNYDPQMELFLPETNSTTPQYAASQTRDLTTGSTSIYNQYLNWLAVNNSRPEQFSGTTNFLDMSDEPVRVRETRKKRIGVFHITNELPMSEDEAKAVLKEKYGDYYTVIKVKKIKPERKILFSRWWMVRPHIGDSTQLKVETALRWHYIKRSDSAFYAEKTRRDSLQFVAYRWNTFWSTLGTNITSTGDPLVEKRITDSLYTMFKQRTQVEQSYNFSVPRMGWINCDKFRNNSNAINFAVNLPPDVKAEKFVSQLVFANIKSVMPGQYGANQFGFAGIPPNRNVYVVALGERNGKVVSVFQHCTTRAAGITIDKFEETTPEAFQKKLQQLDL
ncbi:MAG: hypothetical protein JST86_05275 [Bacteroidetes bacterium]|nr:hypothetical protein [Bacteroidota bacterium]